MKHIKAYENIRVFNFVIDVTNATDEDFKLAFKEFEKYIEVSDYNKKYLTIKNKPWAWMINFWESFGRLSASFNIITSRNWGIGDGGEVDDRVTIKEFIEIGLNGIEEHIKSGKTYIKIKNTANKYNL